MAETLEIGDFGHGTAEDRLEKFGDAVDNASDQDTITWLTEDGKRVAAVVPVEVAEFYESMIAGVQAEFPGFRRPIAKQAQ